MQKVIILGSSNAVSTKSNENTHMVMVGQERMVLVDSVSNTILRLEQAGLDFQNLTDIIITHFHPDHVSGLPLLLMDMWLMGRKKPINIYGLHYTVDRIETLMGLYSWADWPDFYPVAFHRLPKTEKTVVLDCPDFKVSASPVRHLIPNIGLRFDFHRSGKSMAYSCDTEPCEEMERLAEQADILIHEASGKHVGHSSAAQAAGVATRARAQALYLIHYPTGQFANGDPVEEAANDFKGKVALATDFMELHF
jgi:ribonuclease Z